MKVKVKFLGRFELLPAFKDMKEVEVDFVGDTLKELFNHLLSKIGSIRKDIFFDDRGEISSNLSVSINGGSIPQSDWSNQRLEESDSIGLYSFSGG